MKQITALLVLSIASLGLLASAVAGDDKADKEEGFTKIFNGKDLDGWVYGLRGDKENKSGKGYDVENGVMFCTKEDGGNLFTKKEYGDFVFRFEFKSKLSLVESKSNFISRGIAFTCRPDSTASSIDSRPPRRIRKLHDWEVFGNR